MLLLAATPAAAEPVTIAALGDSLTQGFGLPADQGFVPQLQRWLDANGVEATLLNAGVSGDTTAGGLARVGWTLTPEVDGMVVALGGNDLLRGLDPGAARGNIEGILQTAQAADVEVLLVGLTAPGNFGPGYKAEFEAIFPELSAAYDTLLFPDFLAPLTANATRQEALARYMQPDGIHPNADGVALMVEAIGPLVAELAQRAAAP